MRAARFQHRVESPARKSRGDARLELERRAQEETPQRAPLLVVIARLPASRRKTDRAQHAPAVFELRRLDGAVAGGAPLAHELLEHQAEAVARLQLGIEV